MLGEEAIEMLFENVKNDIREDVVQGKFNLYHIGYFNALHHILSVLGMDGVDFWNECRGETETPGKTHEESDGEGVLEKG